MTDSPTDVVSPGAGGLIRRFIQPRLALLGAAGWVTTTYILQQVLRLGSSVVLAWLLAPELLGTMLLINALRTGGELLTDVGVGQGIVNNPRGDERDFYNTAWTIQIVRGVLLFVVAIALTVPLARGYENAELLVLIPAAAPIFLLTGFTSPARFLLQKAHQIRTLALFDLGAAIFATVVQIALAWFMPTIWALIWGLLIGTAGSAIGSYFLMDRGSLRLRWDRDAVQDILRFGKWVFVASLVYFLAMNFDRLYFADAISLSLLGIYGIARTFADTVTQMFQRIGSLMIFPRISASKQRGAGLREAIGPTRMVALVFVAVALAGGIAVADQFIYLVYDDRYRAAAFFLPLLLVGAWFGILGTMSDAIMMGVGKPSGMALSNVAKLVVIVITLPLVLPRLGLTAAIAMLVLAEIVRYAVLMWRQRLVGLGFTRQDVSMTLLFFGLIVLFRELTHLAGYSGGVSDWIVQAGIWHG